VARVDAFWFVGASRNEHDVMLNCCFAVDLVNIYLNIWPTGIGWPVIIQWLARDQGKLVAVMAVLLVAAPPYKLLLM
jgi:hypothetical protein